MRARQWSNRDDRCFGTSGLFTGAFTPGNGKTSIFDRDGASIIAAPLFVLQGRVHVCVPQQPSVNRGRATGAG